MFTSGQPSDINSGHTPIIYFVDNPSMLIFRKRGVYICTPMFASAHVVSSNIVYLGYGYRSTGISALNTEFDL